MINKIDPFQQLNHKISFFKKDQETIKWIPRQNYYDHFISEPLKRQIGKLQHLLQGAQSILL